jgi:hypothetical protein
MQKETSLRDVFDDGYDDKLTLVNALVEVDQETFNASLKDKKPCFVTRFTFVVEHDTEKNRVIFKRYFTNKRSVMVARINKNHLKTHRSYDSLSIDIKTGKFSIYRASTGKKNKRLKPTIRQTAFNLRTLNMIESIFDSGLIDSDEIKAGVNKGLSLMGYRHSVTDYYDEGVLQRIFNTPNKTITFVDHFKTLLALNYFTKNNIKIPNEHSILEHAQNFRLNKKDYFGKSIYDYYADYFDVSVKFIKDVFEYKDNLNYWVFVNKKNGKENWFDEESDKIKKNTLYYSIDEFNLTILYKLGFSVSNIIANKKLSSFLFVQENHVTQFYKNPAKKIPLDILTRNKSSLINILLIENAPRDIIYNLLDKIKIIKDVYGVSVNPDIIYHTDIDQIALALNEATCETGLYTVSKSFLDKVKRVVNNKKIKCSVKPMNRVNKDAKIAESFFSFKRPNLYSEKFCSIITFSDHNGNKIKTLLVYTDHCQTTQYKKSKTISLNDLMVNNKQDALDKAIGKIMSLFDVKDDKLKYTGLKAVYSKKVFEEIMVKKYSEENFKSVMNNIVYLK